MSALNLPPHLLWLAKSAASADPATAMVVTASVVSAQSVASVLNAMSAKSAKSSPLHLLLALAKTCPFKLLALKAPSRPCAAATLLQPLLWP